MNTFTYIFLIFLSLSVIIQLQLSYRHFRHIFSHRNKVPEAFSDNITLSEHQKAADYTQEKIKTNAFDLLLATCFLLIWTLGGTLYAIDQSWRSLGWSELWTGTGFLLCVIAIMFLLDTPMAIYRTFFLEQKFGFNKTSWRTFATDMIKQGVVFLLIATPLLMLILWLMRTAGTWWWLYAWVVWMASSFFIMWAYPTFIAPLFNKFRELENGELRQRIERLLTRNGFSSSGVFVMDGSTRSTHGNAYFTGLGKNKRIVFFDTLLKELSHDEIEAVLAHELGHFCCNHIVKRMIMIAVLSLLGLATLGWLIQMPWFYEGLGIATIVNSEYITLILFAMIFPTFTFFLQPIFSSMSQRHEFEADKFATQQVSAKHLIHALVVLYKENANTLTPDPIYSAFYDSHPPAPIRIARLVLQHK